MGYKATPITSHPAWPARQQASAQLVDMQSFEMDDWTNEPQMSGSIIDFKRVRRKNVAAKWLTAQGEHGLAKAIAIIYTHDEAASGASVGAYALLDRIETRLRHSIKAAQVVREIAIGVLLRLEDDGLIHSGLHELNQRRFNITIKGYEALAAAGYLIQIPAHITV